MYRINKICAQLDIEPQFQEVPAVLENDPPARCTGFARLVEAGRFMEPVTPNTAAQEKLQQLRKELNKHLSKRGHHVCRIVQRQSTDQADSGESVLEYLIVQRNEKRPHILGLREMFVEAFRKRRKNNLSNLRVWASYKLIAGGRAVQSYLDLQLRSSKACQ